MMDEITFPNTVPATAAIVGLSAAIASGAATWPENKQAFFVNEAVPTISLFDPSAREVTDEKFAKEIASVFAILSRGQEPLGAEFESVWDDNVDTLYES